MIAYSPATDCSTGSTVSAWTYEAPERFAIEREPVRPEPPDEPPIQGPPREPTVSDPPTIHRKAQPAKRSKHFGLWSGEDHARREEPGPLGLSPD